MTKRKMEKMWGTGVKEEGRQGRQEKEVTVESDGEEKQELAEEDDGLWDFIQVYKTRGRKTMQQI